MPKCQGPNLPMYGFLRVRYLRAAGKQAALLNILIHRQGITPQEQLKELLGHTPLEVIAGAILGTATGSLF